MRYRKRPVVVEAVQWTGDNAVELCDFVAGPYFDIIAEVDRGDDPGNDAQVYDKLHSVWVPFSIGDWVIRGVQGELYPCKADVFAATYETAGGAREPTATDVVLRYGSGRGQLVVDGKDVAGQVVTAGVHVAAGRCFLSVAVDTFGSSLQFDLEAVELTATLPMSAAARRTLAALAYDEPEGMAKTDAQTDG